ncbi:LysR family transcriptional regulator [Cochlodiniinecator piscidefendens]|uniref:LysR family transcriptional regulator n=1 Tax=Cochlodiniinecator piscidefendens TaxID=2715756 RepID=UPI00140C4247|nr:LysR family transcriptional regulator [Cochlodiniinecator piscidefendens]
MADLPNLVWLRAFEASARLRSFTAAATELGLTQAAISHQVRSLEKSFGVLLFTRRSRTLELTELGHAYYPSISQAIDDIAFSTRGLLGPSRTKTITLRAPISTAVLWIAPKLGAFHAANPAINIRLISAIWADSTEEGDIDVDLRLGPSSWFGRRAHLLAEESVIPVCAAHQAHRIHTVDALFEQELIHIHGFQDHWLRLSRNHGIDISNKPQALFVDTSLAAIELAASGAGVAMMMKRYADGPLKRVQLVQALDLELEMGQGHYLMPTAGPNQHSVEAALVRDWVVGLFQTPRTDAVL